MNTTKEHTMTARSNTAILNGIETLLGLTKFGQLDDLQIATLNRLLDEAEARGI